MKKRFFAKNLLTVLSLILLVAALALSMVSCGKEGDKTDGNESTTESVAETTSEALGTEVGEGKITFTFKVKFKDSSERTYVVNTDKENLADALVEAGLIEGEDGPYGLYVKTVAGETLDYDTDKMYWALYENDAYATKGVSDTVITDGIVYSFVAAS